ncbi:MAG TPA: 2OG-Fe dioxygenase family protein [Candidatus Obscuribacterales bacterium]
MFTGKNVKQDSDEPKAQQDDILHVRARHFLPFKDPNPQIVTDELIATAHKIDLLVDEPLLHKFKLSEFGVNAQDFVDIKHTFDALHDDTYERKLRQVEFLKGKFPKEKQRLRDFLADYYAHDNALEEVAPLLSKLTPVERKEFEQMPTRRKRTIARFDAELGDDGKIRIHRLKAGVFIQLNAPKGHPLSLPRQFEEASEELTEEPGFKRLLYTLCKEIFAHKRCKALQVVVHQVTMQATKDEPFVLPDGIHQDGADFIVSAIPIVLQDVIAPTSTVYDLDHKPLLQTQLQVGEGLFHDDHEYFHSVSDLYTTGTEGKRGTLGFDFRILQ